MSIVIPCYNEEAYIGKLLAGLTKQNYQNLEIIISDAQSGDKSADIIGKFEHPGLKIVYSKPNGPAAQRNFGAKLAKGKWLLFIDADVIIEDKEFVKTLVETAAFNDWSTASANIGLKHASLPERIGTRMDYHYMKLLSHTKHPVAPGWCILTDRQIFENNNGFNEKIYFGEDYDYVSRVGLHGFGFVDDIRYYIDLRRVHEEGLRFLYKCVANEVYRHTHGYDLEKSPYCYKFGDHK